MIEEKCLGQLTTKEIKQLYRSSLKDGFLKGMLDDYVQTTYFTKETESLVKFYLIKRDGKIVAWCLIDASKAYTASVHPQLHVYTQVRYRGQGMAKMLIEKALSDIPTKYKTVGAKPWTKQGRLLYSKYDRIEFYV